MFAESEEELLRNLALLDKVIREKEAVGHPGTYGMPDLLYPKGYKQGVPTFNREGLHTSALGEDFPDGWTREKLGHEESDSEYKERQDQDLMGFLEKNIYVAKDGKKRYFRVIPPIKPFICDVFFLRTKKVIVWKPRGGGGSLGASVLIWLLMIYHRRSVLDISGSGEQSKVVYKYVCQFWECIPGITEGLLESEPLKEETRLNTGVELFCLLPDTEIISNKGLIPIKDIQVGDKVLSRNGVFNDVEYTIPSKRSETCIELSVKGTPNVKTTKDHKLWAVKLTEKQKKQQRAYGWKSLNPEDFEPQWIEAKDLEIDDLICYPKIVTTPVKNAISGSRYIDGRGKFSIELTPDFYRFLGYWLADGSKSKTHIDFFFNKDEKNYVDDVVSLIKTLFKVKPCVYRRKNVSIVHFGHAALLRWMKDFGSKDSKHIPLYLIQEATQEQLEQLFIGMFRGDGSSTQSKDKLGYFKSECSYKTISPEIAQIMFLIATKLGFIPAIKKYNMKDTLISGVCYNRKPIYIIRFSGEDAAKIGNITGKRFKTKAPESFRKTSISTDTTIFRPVIGKKEFFYDGIVYDITVKEDHSFCSPYVSFSNCKPGTEKQVRGKHMSVLAIDEVCQEDARVETAFRAALQTVLSEEDSIVLLFSTFHLPSGLFQEYWDQAEEKGFHKVKWNVFDTMSPCSRGLEHATPEDPKALCYCEKCDLTAPDIVLDDRGNKKQVGWKWCYGHARDVSGWASYEEIASAMRMNIGTNIFETEFCCNRPNYSNSIYGPELIDYALSDSVELSEDSELSVGIDWGLKTKGSLAISLVERRLDHMFIHECVFWENKLVSDVVNLLNEWTKKYNKPFKVFSDRSHPFNNADLAKAGFDVNPIDFGTYKAIGIENISKYLVFRRMRINRELAILIDQLKKYRSDDKGKAVKKDDHGPDSVMCAMLQWKFEDIFGEDAYRVSLEDLRLNSEKEAMLASKRVNTAALAGTSFKERMSIPKGLSINGKTL